MFPRARKYRSCPQDGLIERKIEEIAQIKAKDLNAIDIEGAEQTVLGTARSMGIGIE